MTRGRDRPCGPNGFAGTEPSRTTEIPFLVSSDGRPLVQEVYRRCRFEHHPLCCPSPKHGPNSSRRHRPSRAQLKGAGVRGRTISVRSLLTQLFQGNPGEQMGGDAKRGKHNRLGAGLRTEAAHVPDLALENHARRGLRAGEQFLGLAPFRSLSRGFRYF